MKNKIKWLGIIVLVSIIGFTMVACDDTSNGEITSFPSVFRGTWVHILDDSETINITANNINYNKSSDNTIYTFVSGEYKGNGTYLGSPITNGHEFVIIEEGSNGDTKSLIAAFTETGSLVFDRLFNGLYIKQVSVHTSISDSRFNGTFEWTSTQDNLTQSWVFDGTNKAIFISTSGNSSFQEIKLENSLFWSRPWNYEVWQDGTTYSFDNAGNLILYGIMVYTKKD